MAAIQSDRLARLAQCSNDDVKTRLIFEWVKTGKMPLKEFRVHIRNLCTPSFQADQTEE